MADRRWWHPSAALGLALLSVLLVVATITLPVRAWLASHRQLMAQAHQATLQGQALVRTRPRLEQLLNQTLAAGQGTDFYLRDPSRNLAAATLQERIRTAFQQHEATIQSLQELGAAEGTPATDLTVRAQATLPYEAAYVLLGELEDTTPPLVIDQLTLRVVPTLGQSAGASAIVDLAFDVTGFAAPDARP